jgi:hypothetical protein
MDLSGVTFFQNCSEIEILEKNSEIFPFLTFLGNFEFLPWLQIFIILFQNYPTTQFTLVTSILSFTRSQAVTELQVKLHNFCSFCNDFGKKR